MIGQVRGLIVYMKGQFNRYSVTVCGYGYLGDLLKDSENKRWMGPKRYDWSSKGFDNLHVGAV